MEKTLKVAVTDFEALGIDPETYDQRNYERTQVVGAAINFLELDGLIAPSARWDCDNLMIFENKRVLNSKLTVTASRVVPFDEWAALAGSG